MQYREKSGQTLTEPVSSAEMLTYIGLSTLDDNNTIILDDMIKAAREWLEEYTGFSILSKSYEVRYYIEDKIGEYYELPFSPVTSITSVEISGTAVEYDEKGLDRKYIRPQSSIITNATTDEAYLDCEFIAGATSYKGNIALRRMVNDMWDNRKDDLPSAPAFGLSWRTMVYIEQLSTNTEI